MQPAVWISGFYLWINENIPSCANLRIADCISVANFDPKPCLEVTKFVECILQPWYIGSYKISHQRLRKHLRPNPWWPSQSRIFQPWQWKRSVWCRCMRLNSKGFNCLTFAWHRMLCCLWGSSDSGIVSSATVAVIQYIRRTKCVSSGVVNQLPAPPAKYRVCNQYALFASTRHLTKPAWHVVNGSQSHQYSRCIDVMQRRCMTLYETIQARDLQADFVLTQLSQSRPNQTRSHLALSDQTALAYAELALSLARAALVATCMQKCNIYAWYTVLS